MNTTIIGVTDMCYWGVCLLNIITLHLGLHLVCLFFQFIFLVFNFYKYIGLQCNVN